MAKKGTFNSSFFGNFASRLHGTPVRFGILLGQRVEASLGDVVLAAATPQVPKEDGEAPPIKDVATLLKSQQGDSSFANWAAQHIDSLSKLVPGGIVPLGCFVVASEATAKDLAPQLVPPMRNLIDPLVLSIDPSSRKTSWLQLSMGPKPALRQAQMKAEAYKEHLLLWTTTELDVMLPFDGSRPHDGADTEELVEQTSSYSQGDAENGEKERSHRFNKHLRVEGSEDAMLPTKADKVAPDDGLSPHTSGTTVGSRRRNSLTKGMSIIVSRTQVSTYKLDVDPLMPLVIAGGVILAACAGMVNAIAFVIAESLVTHVTGSVSKAPMHAMAR
ncbi:Protein odr-4-like [Symbiodinium microadriaticum]|uniref:Protein odr-4-like n=1 Tax=Symbiodinium microadriaticum TaxID=2951 RepID=A0A1Q9ELA6_SYMMI|nr:Protein odr-4-like [Symbiodinium microadriaticum]